MDQGVLRRNRGAVRIRQKIGGIKNRIPVEAVVIITDGDLVASTEGVVCFPNDFVIVVVLRPQEDHRSACSQRQTL